jgi:hypothetical protein
MTMHVCPKGHQSQAGDYCDECGAPIAGQRSTSATGTRTSAPTTAPDTASPSGPDCPECATPQSGRFCEVCGFDFLMVKLGGTGTRTGDTPPDAADSPDTGAVPEQRGGTVTGLPKRTSQADDPGGWALTVASDAAYHARMQAMAEPDAAPIAFPAFVPPRRFVLRGAQALIGRPSKSRGIEPEIDLSGPPADPAVSHAHAMLLAQPDGFWAIVDLESANGTYVNDETDAIEPNAPRLLDAGDRIFVGAWTALTLTRTV